MRTPEMTPWCTPRCEPRETWVGGTLYDRRIIHRHGPVRWGGYDAQDLGLGCSHASRDTCAGLRDRAALTAAGAS